MFAEDSPSSLTAICFSFSPLPTQSPALKVYQGRNLTSILYDSSEFYPLRVVYKRMLARVLTWDWYMVIQINTRIWAHSVGKLEIGTLLRNMFE